MAWHAAEPLPAELTAAQPAPSCVERVSLVQLIRPVEPTVDVVAKDEVGREGSIFQGGRHDVWADEPVPRVHLCDAYGLPLLYLADVPGFMIGKQVERQGIIRAGAKMVQAVSEAQVPRISVVVRKAYGAGLYAMSGPGFAPDACLALPTAMIVVMGAEAAVNAVHYNRLQAMPEGPSARSKTEKLRDEYRADIDIEAARERTRHRRDRRARAAARRAGRALPHTRRSPPRSGPAEAEKRHADVTTAGSARRRASSASAAAAANGSQRDSGTVTAGACSNRLASRMPVWNAPSA